MKHFPKRLFNILLFVFAILFLALILTSCSDSARAKRLVRQGYAKIKKAEALDPTSVDSIKSKLKVDIEVPEQSGNIQTNTELDSSAFEKAINRYDSLKAWLAKLTVNKELDSIEWQELHAYHIELENKSTTIISKNEVLQKANAALTASRNRLMSGFAKDSVYTYSDSALVIQVDIRAGLMRKIVYKVKERKVSKTVDTTNIKLNSSPSMWRQTWFWVMACFCLVLLLIIFVILAVKRR